MKSGSSLLVSAFVVGCASLYMACERDQPNESADSSGAANREGAQAAAREAEPNDTVATASEIPSDRRLAGGVQSDDEDVLSFRSGSLGRGSALELTAESGYVTVEVFHEPLRWNLTRLQAGETLDISPDSLPIGASLILSGSGDWSILQTEADWSRAADTERSSRCRFAPVTEEAQLRWASRDGSRSVKLCVDGEGAIELPEEWSGRVARLSARSLTGTPVELRVPSDDGGATVLEVGSSAEGSIEAVRISEGGPSAIGVTSDEPATLEFSIGFGDGEHSSDIEPNKGPELATDVSEKRSPYSGALHSGETSDWLEIPWGEAETMNLTLSLSRHARSSLRWQTVDGKNEMAVADEASSVSVCALWREAGSGTLKVGVDIAEPNENPIGWSIRTESPAMASFEREPNEDRLLALEVPAVGQSHSSQAIARFAVPGRQPSSHVEGFLGNADDVLDMIPLRIQGPTTGQGTSNGHGTSEVELILRPPASSDLNLSLVDEDGGLVARGLSAGTGNQERIRVSLPTGVYHAVIEHVSGDGCAGGYRVEVSTLESTGATRNEANRSEDSGAADSRDEQTADGEDQPSERPQAPPPLMRRE